ncbi:hypothetical protein AX16_006868 [Volvariella volvacea WC 439]|nr:hypothetical protein AX16_006868 [Volvariella volvacea WC 439]
MVDGEFHHRPTLKQQNKKFKSKHATKGQLKAASKGRTARPSVKATIATKSNAQIRLNRRNNAKQIQSKKREELIASTRVFHGADGAPRIVAIIPLTGDVNPHSILTALAGSLDIPTEACPQYGLWKMRVDRFKASLQFISIPYRNFYAALDAARIADYVIFGLSPNVEVEPWGDTLLRTLQAQGMPDVVSVVAPDLSIDQKSRPAILKSLASFIQYFIPSQHRIYDLHASSDRLNALRSLCEGKPSIVRWREDRTWMLGEQTEWENGILKVTGVIRGTPMSANRLVHIPTFGDFQISQITSAPSTRPTRNPNARMEVESTVLAEPDPEEADSLVSTNVPDDMANEQTWPTEEEMEGGAGVTNDPSLPDALAGTTPKVVRKLPKGTSDYQAAWIFEDDEDEGSAEEGELGEDDEKPQGEDDAMEEMALDDDDDRREDDFEDLDADEEQKQLTKWKNREREEQDDLAFPDEIDTPQDIPARIRFQRFRGMRSFRTSPWDPYENLPRDYARIFQFEDYKKSARIVLELSLEGDSIVQPGTRVVLHLKDVPQEVAHAGPIVLFGLLQHEHKMTALNFTVQRNTEYSESVRSKDPLILCIGPRRLRVNPIYSQHTRGGSKGANNVHKFERYLRHGATYVATTYGPIVFGNQPCTLLRETEDPQAPQLVGMGSFYNPDTTRIIAKRIILTGHPFKVHKKTATVRYMFFNPDDIQYFKPIQLHTKYGRVGHIRESLGTHGYFKAHFDRPITQMDTVCMSLYKRVYPKWSEMWTPNPQQRASSAASDAMEE